MIIDLSKATADTAPDIISQAISELFYINYSENRRLAPTITPEQWKVIFGASVEAMERQYQVENGARLAGMVTDAQAQDTYPNGWPFK